MVLAAAVGKQPLLGFGGIVEIFGMLAGEQAGNVGGEAYPEEISPLHSLSLRYSRDDV